MISLRLPPELERKLDSFAKSEGKSRSEIVKDSILEYIKNHGRIKTPFELGEDLIWKTRFWYFRFSSKSEKISSSIN